MEHVTLVNNTATDITMYYPVLLKCIMEGAQMPEELCDIFTLKIININGRPRGILNFA